MLYRETVEWIRNIERSGSDFGIERMRELLALLDNPEKNLKIVHIAGTNGKGSVCAYLTSIAISSCLRVGTYNSPSVFDYNDRFLLNGEPLFGGLVAKYFSVIREVVEKEQARRNKEGGEFKPTAFELETAFALYCFAQEKCGLVILETGLGGRWDATNAVDNKELAVITKIGLDHCELMGNSLSKIAAEKAGIIRKNAVSCLQPKEVLDVLESKCKDCGGELVITSAASPICGDIEGQYFEYKGERYSIKLLGEHQIENAALAVETIFTLNKQGWDFKIDDIKFGLSETEWRGRFDLIGEHNNRFNLIFPHNKLLILDGAHNPQGAESLIAALSNYFGGMRLHLVVGILADKDYKQMAKLLAPVASRVTTVTPPSPRALDAVILADEFNALGVKAEPCEHIPLAVQAALGGSCDVVVVCGSLTLFQTLGRK